MIVQNNTMMFLQKVDRDYYAYMKKARRMSKKKLLANMQEIALFQKMYDYLKSNVSLQVDGINLLAQYKHPMFILHDCYMNNEWDYLSELISDIMDYILFNYEDLSSYEMELAV